ncbi:hypothetical protein K493DRAFT_292159 [Basidiobolus meristosporus CBS 931.73]|uniref:Agmatine deiminase n=1 Tax=Basidiobolus meristosporus CBS 931.73 TaxID=1314790 RepID=A0A1Y1XB44_9FUNG|nr:hypothetical protein K493DRAFT_292159 [Basidiobolus meristosporus CBS 931.73]|eukprot:ORX82965.1 hypothetical protein K493DRAFT_292159 [Basidiobolus meristosporus CBS 931.73]
MKTLNKIPAGFRITPEWEPHKRTIMAWPASKDGWQSLLEGTQRNIVQIAQAISRFEPVQVLAAPDQLEKAQKSLGDKIEVIPVAVDDLWTRDTSPMFLTKGKETIGVDFNFNGWGNKYEAEARQRDGHVARNFLAHHQLPRFQSSLTSEGGAIESDGRGTLIITESSIVNDNRNRGKSRSEIELALETELGIQKVIWLRGVKGMDITDSHVDTLARFVAPGVVVVSRPAPTSDKDPKSLVWAQQYEQAMEVLTRATDATGNRLRLVDLPEPDHQKIRGTPAEGRNDEAHDYTTDFEESFLPSYANFYIANGAIIMPEFGDVVADRRAQEILQEVFPDRVIVPLNIDYVASGGGGIHCATHDQPEVEV